MKKKPFITSNQVKNTLEEEGMSLIKPTIKRHLCECTYRKFTSGCKPPVSLKIRKAGLDVVSKHLKILPSSGITFFGQKLRLSCTRMMGTERSGERKGRDLKHTTPGKKGGSCVIGMGGHGCQWNWMTGVY